MFTNYTWLTTVQTFDPLDTSNPDNFGIAGGLRTASGSNPEYRKVFINLVPRPGGGLFITVSVQHGAVMTKVIDKFPYTTSIPVKGLKYGISSSTGGSNNFHEIRGLSMTVDQNTLIQPEAVNDMVSVCQGYSTTPFDILSNDILPNVGGTVNMASVDLDPSTFAFEQQISKPGEGTFTFDPASGKVTFVPVAGFKSSSVISYNFMDVYGKVSKTGTITVNTISPIITQQPSGATLCQGATFTSIVAASSTGSGISYQWQSFDGTGWIDIPGATTPTFTLTNVSVSANNGNKYRVRVTATTTVTCNVFSNEVVLNVNPIPDVTVPAGLFYCNNETVASIQLSGSLDKTTYSWINSNPAIGLANKGDGDVPSFKALNTTNGPIVATITVTPVSLAGCTGTAKTFTITVNPTAIVDQPGNVKYCNQANTTPVVFTDNGTGSTYSWTNDHAEIGLPLSGTGQVPSFKALNTTNSPIVATITVTPTSSEGCAGTAKTFTITVNPTAIVDQPTSVKYCNQITTAPVVFTDNGTGSNYSWTNDHDEIGLPLSGTGQVRFHLSKL
ncbi:PKD-like domain-containing protein [Pedobacter sp. NJ-S-72]